MYIVYFILHLDVSIFNQQKYFTGNIQGKVKTKQKVTLLKRKPKQNQRKKQDKKVKIYKSQKKRKEKMRQ